MLRALLFVVLGAGAALAVDRLVLYSEDEPVPTVPAERPAPGSPPLVWLDGTLAEVGPGSLALRDGASAAVDLERAAAGATRFFRLDGDAWAPLSEEDADATAAGQRACVEALLDGRTLLALRVFLGAGCGPAPG
ncbi:MAG TPA: hypothetical protein VHH92_07510 [Actinomycetota bacterium]|nr:hypothetical protein [Actinomycetota bacterium]